MNMISSQGYWMFSSAFILLFILVGLLLGSFLTRRILQGSGWMRPVFWAAAFGLGAIAIVGSLLTYGGIGRFGSFGHRLGLPGWFPSDYDFSHTFYSWMDPSWLSSLPFELGPILSLLSKGLVFICVLPLIAKVSRKWIGGQLTPEEQAPGMEGVRAWLGGGNLTVACMVAFFAWVGFGYSFFAVLALIVLALLAYPFLNILSQPLSGLQPPREDLSNERERVLRMLEEGKITAEESIELLNALGQTVQSGPAAASETAKDPARKLVMVGAALVFLGFFLPWFTLSPGLEISRATAMTHPYSFHVTGSHVNHGLGWLVLLLGLGVAASPYLASRMDRRTLRTWTFLALAAGAIILLVLLTQNLRHASIGLILALAGFGAEFVGTMREQQQSAGQPV